MYTQHVYTCICVCMYVYIYIYIIHIHTCLYIHIYNYMCNADSFVLYGITCLTRLMQLAAFFATLEEHLR